MLTYIQPCSPFVGPCRSCNPIVVEVADRMRFLAGRSAGLEVSEPIRGRSSAEPTAIGSATLKARPPKKPVLKVRITREPAGASSKRRGAGIQSTLLVSGEALGSHGMRKRY
jgi:hypothetical protein